MGTLLTTAIISRFSKPVWVEVPEVCAGAKFLLLPITRTKLQQLARKFNICQECGGSGLVSLREQSQNGEVVAERGREVCPRCKGRSANSWGDYEVRLHIVRDMVHNWEGLKAVDPDTQEETVVEYSDEVRDALAETAAFDVLFEKAIQLAVKREEQAGKV
jgi:hypothetical protein